MDRYNRKILRYTKRHPNCEINKNDKKYITITHLCNQGFVSYFEGRNTDGYRENHIYYFITPTGKDALSDSSWFNPEFLAKQIIVPIVISTITTLITLALTSLLT